MRPRRGCVRVVVVMMVVVVHVVGVVVGVGVVRELPAARRAARGGRWVQHAGG